MSVITSYFEAWNAQDLEKIRSMLADEAILIDWDIKAEGGDAVTAANKGIFEALPNIKIDVINVHEAQGSFACEIEVKLNDGSDTVLKVCDVIGVNGDGKITYVRAYKQ